MSDALIGVIAVNDRARGVLDAPGEVRELQSFDIGAHEQVGHHKIWRINAQAVEGRAKVGDTAGQTVRDYDVEQQLAKRDVRFDDENATFMVRDETTSADKGLPDQNT